LWISTKTNLLFYGAASAPVSVFFGFIGVPTGTRKSGTIVDLKSRTLAPYQKVNMCLKSFLFILKNPHQVLVWVFALKGEQREAAKQTPDR
jgi:hypothetical protein